MNTKKTTEPELILVSACLAGCNCRYDGGNKEQAKILQLIKEGKAIPVCPEQLAGLPTPRPPVEIDDSGRAVDINGVDQTEVFQRGANETLKLCQKLNIKRAILKSKSPSCGYKQVYNGEFKGELRDGNGITAELLQANGIEVITSDEL